MMEHPCPLHTQMLPLLTEALTHKTFRMCHCMATPGRVPGEPLWKARCAQLGPAEELR
jgi:hypothetical protein